MSNILLLSIRPKYANKIFKDRTKKVELRRVRPRLESGDIVLVYASSPTKAVVGCFTVKKIIVEESIAELWELVEDKAGITHEEFFTYYQGAKRGVGIFLTNIETFSNPVDLESLRQQLSDFNRPPQSYCYLTHIDWEIIRDIGQQKMARVNRQ